MTLYSLPAKVSHENAQSVLSEGMALLANIQANGSLNIDCQKLDIFDSSALSIILAIKRQAQKKVISIQLQAVPEKLASLAKVYGVADIVLS